MEIKILLLIIGFVIMGVSFGFWLGASLSQGGPAPKYVSTLLYGLSLWMIFINLIDAYLIFVGK